MKKLFLFPFLMTVLFLTSCSKGSTELQAPSKIDMLLTKLKADQQFNEYLMHMKNASDAIANDVNKLAVSDTSVAMSQSLTFAEKANSLKFQNTNQMVEEMKKANELMIDLLKRYPTLAELNAEESKVFYKKAVVNYLKTSKKSK